MLPPTVLADVWPLDCVVGEDNGADEDVSLTVLDEVEVGVIDADCDVSGVTLVLDAELGIVPVLAATVFLIVVGVLLVNSLVDCIVTVVLPPVLL